MERATRRCLTYGGVSFLSVARRLFLLSLRGWTSGKERAIDGQLVSVMITERREPVDGDDIEEDELQKSLSGLSQAERSGDDVGFRFVLLEFLSIQALKYSHLTVSLVSYSVSLSICCNLLTWTTWRNNVLFLFLFSPLTFVLLVFLHLPFNLCGQTNEPVGRHESIDVCVRMIITRHIPPLLFCLSEQKGPSLISS